MLDLLQRYRRGLGCWYIDALCQGLMIGFCEVLIVIWYSRHIKDAITLGAMLTLPAAIGAITQALTTRYRDFFRGTHNLAIAAIGTQVCGLTLLVIAVSDIQMSWSLLFIGQSLYWMGGMTAMSPTQEILAQAVPVARHNRFFSRRAMIITAFTLVCNFLLGWYLNQGMGYQQMTFLLGAAAVARAVSLVLMLWHRPDNQHLSCAPSPSINDRDANLSILKLSLCMMVFRCAVNISSPFYSAYMLNELALSFGVYSILTAVPLISKTFCLHNWARLLDDNRKFEGLVLATILIGAVPLMWSLSNALPWLGSLQVLSGVSWSGFDLISVLLIQHMYPRSITRNLGLFMALSSLGSVGGGMLGGFILNKFGSYQTVFAFSGCARLGTGFFLLWYLRRNHLFRFHRLNLKHGLATLVTVRPSIEAAAKLIPLPMRRPDRRDEAA